MAKLVKPFGLQNVNGIKSAQSLFLCAIRWKSEGIYTNFVTLDAQYYLISQNMPLDIILGATERSRLDIYQ